MLRMPLIVSTIVVSSGVMRHSKIAGEAMFMMNGGDAQLLYVGAGGGAGSAATTAVSPSALKPWPIPSPTNTAGSQSPDQSGSFANAATRGGSCGGGGPAHAK